LTDKPVDGYVQLALTILVTAKQDAANYWSDTDLWHTFQREYNISDARAVDVAGWVGGFILNDWRTGGRKTETT